MSSQMDSAGNDSLRYLDANAVQCPAGKLEGLRLIGLDDKSLGSIDGVLIDPVRRKLRYYVVAATRLFNRRRYLVPADDLTVKIGDDGALRVETSSENIDRLRFDARSIPRFSDDDLMAALFSPQTT